ISRLKEILYNDINVCFGHDDLLDTIYPLGTGNMMQVLSMGVHVCHLTRNETMNRSLDLITYNSAKTLQIDSSYDIKIDGKADMIILWANNDYEALRLQSPVLFSIKNGKVI